MVRYLFYSIGDLTYQSTLVGISVLYNCISMARILSVLHQMTNRSTLFVHYNVCKLVHNTGCQMTWRLANN